MKKTACFALALLMLLSAAGSALAATVSYADGKLTVSQQDGVYMILIDGANTGKWVGAGMPSVTFDYPLEQGTMHQLVLLSLAGDGNIGAMEAFWAGPSPAPTEAPTPTPAPIQAPAPEPAQPTEAPTEEPTEAPTEEPTPEPTPEIQGPVKIESASYADESLSLVIAGLRGYAEIWVDSQNTGLIVKENGDYSLNRALTAGTHTVSLYAPAYNEVDSADFYVRFAPGPEITDAAALGALLKNDAGDAVPYSLAYSSDQTGVLMILSPDGIGAEPDEISLYLSEDLLNKLKNNGVGCIRLMLGGAGLNIRLDAVKPSLFTTDKAIWYYVFSISLTPEKLCRVNVAAQTSLTDRIDAGEYAGVTLIKGGEEIPVEVNGLY